MGRNRRKKFSCDFETTTDPLDCRVWGYGVMEIGNHANYHIDNSIEKFMKWAEKQNGDLFFHNLKFDGSFIVNWLLKNGYEFSDSGLPKTFNAIISSMGQWYMIDICYGYKGNRKLRTVMYDSLKKLPFSVERIGNAFNLATLKIDVTQEFYNRPRPVGHVITGEEYEYIKHDIKVIAEALEIQFKQGLESMTIGSDSLKGYKAIINPKYYDKLFPTFSLALDSELRLAYRGGFTWLNKKYAGKDVGKGIVFDVNSLYPSVMYNEFLPYGKPINYYGAYKEDEDYPLYIQHIQCEFIVKENRIPTIQIKNKAQQLLFKKNEYLESSKGEVVDLYVTNVDLELIKEHYDLYDLKYLEGWKFRAKKGMFNKYIERWAFVKETNTGALRELAKLMLNSLYGKFASNPNVTGKVPYLREDGSNGFYLDEDEYKDPEYTPMGVFITSYARFECISTAQSCFDRIIYCDTDSIHLVGTEIPVSLKDKIDKTKMGYWDHEATYDNARYVKQKTYILKTGDDLKVTCAGMSDRVKKKVTWDNFHIGFRSFGNLRGKQVSGGMVLNDSEFSLN